MDRIVVLRAVLVIVAVAFVLLVARVAIQAFGGAGEARRVERAGGAAETGRKSGEGAPVPAAQGRP